MKIPHAFKSQPFIHSFIHSYILIFSAVLELRDKISVPLLCADTELPGVKEEMKTKDITFLPPILATMSSEQLTEKYAGYNDPIFYIYTSGTTGIINIHECNQCCNNKQTKTCYFGLTY